MKLKTSMVISGARFLFYDLLIHYQFSDDDENRILRCCEDLFNCVKESDENVTQEDLRKIDDMQAKIEHLREALKNICIMARRGKSSQLFTPETAVLLSIENDCLIALNGESEGGND